MAEKNLPKIRDDDGDVAHGRPQGEGPESVPMNVEDSHTESSDGDNLKEVVTSSVSSFVAPDAMDMDKCMATAKEFLLNAEGAGTSSSDAIHEVAESYTRIYKTYNSFQMEFMPAVTEMENDRFKNASTKIVDQRYRRPSRPRRKRGEMLLSPHRASRLSRYLEDLGVIENEKDISESVGKDIEKGSDKEVKDLLSAVLADGGPITWDAYKSPTTSEKDIALVVGEGVEKEEVKCKDAVSIACQTSPASSPLPQTKSASTSVTDFMPQLTIIHMPNISVDGGEEYAKEKVKEEEEEDEVTLTPESIIIPFPFKDEPNAAGPTTCQPLPSGPIAIENTEALVPNTAALTLRDDYDSASIEAELDLLTTVRAPCEHIFTTIHIEAANSPTSSLMRRPPLCTRMWTVIADFCAAVCLCLQVNTDYFFPIMCGITMLVSVSLLTAFFYRSLSLTLATANAAA